MGSNWKLCIELMRSYRFRCMNWVANMGVKWARSSCHSKSLNDNDNKNIRKHTRTHTRTPITSQDFFFWEKCPDVSIPYWKDGSAIIEVKWNEIKSTHNNLRGCRYFPLALLFPMLVFLGFCSIFMVFWCLFFTVVGFYHRKMYVVLQMSGRDIYNRIKSHWLKQNTHTTRMR